MSDDVEFGLDGMAEIKATSGTVHVTEVSG